MVKQLHEVLKQWTWCGLNGGVIVGEARIGKTVAIRSIDNTITSRTGEKIPVFRISMGERDVKTIRSVYCRIARALGQPVHNNKTADDLALVVNMYLSEASLINQSHQVILIIDEAQILTIGQLSVFAEIYNDLFEIHYNCIIYFVANENQFSSMANDLLDDENKYTRERFFDHVHHFYGIRNSEELSVCLERYDEYIIDDFKNMTALEYYCPSLYAKGWRLKNIAVPMWKLYYDNYMSILNHHSWSMSQFVRTTNILLMDYLVKYEYKLNDELVEGLIIRSLEGAAIKPSIEKFIA